MKVTSLSCDRKSSGSASGALGENGLSYAPEQQGFAAGALVKSLLAVQEMQGLGFDPWVRTSPGAGNGNPLQYSCPGKIPWAKESGELPTVHRFTEESAAME